MLIAIFNMDDSSAANHHDDAGLQQIRKYGHDLWEPFKRRINDRAEL